MKASKFFLAAILLAWFAASHCGPAWGQQSKAGPPLPRAGQYNKSAEVVVAGTIQSIEGDDGASMPVTGTYITLQSSPVTFHVHLGIFSAAQVPFKVGESVSVTGALVNVRGAQILMARLIKSASQSLVIRSANGFVVRPHPASSGQGGLQ